MPDISFESLVINFYVAYIDMLRYINIMESEKFEHFNEAAECLKVLAHPMRLRIVALLLEEARTVGEIAAAVKIQSHVASEHLRLMLRCGFLGARRDGRSITYSVIEPHLKELLGCIENRFNTKSRNIQRSKNGTK